MGPGVLLVLAASFCVVWTQFVPPVSKISLTTLTRRVIKARLLSDCIVFSDDSDLLSRLFTAVTFVCLQYTEDCRTDMYPPKGPTYVTLLCSCHVNVLELLQKLRDSPGS